MSSDVVPLRVTALVTRRQELTSIPRTTDSPSRQHITSPVRPVDKLPVSGSRCPGSLFTLPSVSFIDTTPGNFGTCMSTAAGAPSNGANAGVKSPESKNKGKAKRVVSPDVNMEEEEEEDEDEGEEEEMEEEDSDEDSDEEVPEIDPSAIISGGRRTRGVKVDYTSKEALEKAGLKPEDLEDDDDEDMKQMDDQ